MRKAVIISGTALALILSVGYTNIESLASTHDSISIVAINGETQKQALINDKEDIEYLVYYVTAKCLNIRKNPNKNSEIIGKLFFGESVNAYIDGEWAQLKDGRYVNAKYLSDKENSHILYDAPFSNGMKSYMPYMVKGKSIFSKSSNQYKLQELCYTGNFGIRQYKERYCVAIGSYYNTDIGQFFDLILENGSVIPCLMADQKADCDTDSDNIITVSNGCMSEFVIDNDILSDEVKRNGDISYCTDDWKSRVVEIKIYEKNAFYDN